MLIILFCLWSRVMYLYSTKCLTFPAAAHGTQPGYISVKSLNYLLNYPTLGRCLKWHIHLLWLILCDSVMICWIVQCAYKDSGNEDVLTICCLSLSTDKTNNLLSCLVSSSDLSSSSLSTSPSSHAVTLLVCTCQISLTSSAATPYDTPAYCPEPACQLTLYVFMHLCACAWKGMWKKEAMMKLSHADCRCVKCEADWFPVSSSCCSRICLGNIC